MPTPYFDENGKGYNSVLVTATSDQKTGVLNVNTGGTYSSPAAWSLTQYADTLNLSDDDTTVLTSDSIPCSAVLVYAPPGLVGTPSNTEGFWVGNISVQPIYVAMDNYTGVVIKTDNVNKVYATRINSTEVSVVWVALS